MKNPRLCHEVKDLAFPIKLEQLGVDRFRVTYGLQVDDELTYGRAAAKYGEAIMHALACDSKLDNRIRGERAQ